MYTQIWLKYLPIIRILLKRSANGEQVLDLNVSDFERAGAGRKSGYKFNISFGNGKAEAINAPAMAKELAAILLEDQVAKELFTNNHYAISMSAKFRLTIQMTVKGSGQDTEEMVEKMETEVHP